MTYNEIKRRLTKCEKTLALFKKQDLSKATPEERQQAQTNIISVNESIVKYKQMLSESKTYLVTPKSGQTSAVSMSDDEVDALKDADDVDAIKSVDGEEIKEEDGVTFSIDETKAIAKKVGKAVAMSLKALGDAVRTMRATHIEENSFDIEVEYKNNKDDAFAFHIVGDKLHLADFTFDKELVDVGVKPSGEPIVQVDVLSNELQKHFKSLSEDDISEANYDYYTEPKHFDICPGAEALRDEVIEGGKSPQELGEWTFKHDELFKLEKAVLKAKKADERHVKIANGLRDEIIHLSRDLGIEAGKINYLKGHVKKIEDVANGVLSEAEGDDHHYIKVTKSDYKEAMRILDTNVDPTYVKTEVVDDDGAGNVIIYFVFRHEYGFDSMYDDPEGKENPELYQEPDEDPHAFMYDVVMDLAARGVDVVDHSAELDEARDINDPALLKFRASKIAAKKKAAQRADDKMANAIGSNPYDSRKDSLVAKLKAMRAQIMRDMEQEAEPEGGPIADAYGEKLNKIDAAIAKASGQKTMDYDTAVGLRENQPTVFDDESMNALRDIILKYVEDPDAAEKLVQQVDDHGLDSLPDDLEAQLDRDPEFEAWYHKLHYGNDANTDYMQRRRDEKDYMSEGTDLYDRNGIQITRFSGGKRGLMVQINYGGKYIHVPADEFANLARAMQSVQGDLKDMSRQLPRNKNQDEGSKQHPSKGHRGGAKKVQKAYDLVVAKMKELAKDYKGGDKSVVDQLKDLTAKKKALELSLDKAVAGTNRGQELTEVTEDQVQDAIYELRNLIDEIEAKAEEAREVVRDVFPNELSRLDAYGAFNAMNSANRYDVTLGGFVDRLEEEGYEIDDDGNVETLEEKSEHQGTNYKWPMSKATKDRKEADVAKNAKEKKPLKKETAPGFKHDCAAKVIHKEHGAGTCIPEKHTLVKEGSKYVVTHYDVLFENGKTVTDIPVSELEIKTQTEHWHKGYKKKKK